jgi:putative peptidoglycan lipid II flippase
MIRYAHMGHPGLALSTSAVALFGFVLLFEVLRRRIGGVYGRTLAVQVMKVAGASVAMSGAVALTSGRMEAWLGISQLARLADLALSIPAGVAVYYWVCRALKVSELDTVVRAFGAPLRRRLGR